MTRGDKQLDRFEDDDTVEDWLKEHWLKDMTRGDTCYRWRDPGVNMGYAIVTLPAHLHESLVAFIEQGAPTGSFLQAVLEDSLFDAGRRADEQSTKMLLPLARWIFNYAPSGCQGSPENYRSWRDAGGWSQYEEVLP